MCGLKRNDVLFAKIVMVCFCYDVVFVVLQAPTEKNKEPSQESLAPSLVVAALRAAIKCGHEEQTETQLHNLSAWSMLSDPVEFPTGIQLVMRGMCMQVKKHTYDKCCFLLIH
jgi:hypothetical protein